MITCKHDYSEAPVLALKTLSCGITACLYLSAQQTYQKIADLMARQGTNTTALSPAYKYLPHASSMSLNAVADSTLINTLLGEISRIILDTTNESR